MTEFNPNCGKCGMLNSRGFCSMTACRYPSNAIVVEPKVIRGMMVNPQIEKPQTNADRIRAMTDEELADFLWSIDTQDYDFYGDLDMRTIIMSIGFRDVESVLEWLKQEVDNAE